MARGLSTRLHGHNEWKMSLVEIVVSTFLGSLHPRAFSPDTFNQSWKERHHV
jgi:hypothetical protein